MVHAASEMLPWAGHDAGRAATPLATPNSRLAVTHPWFPFGCASVRAHVAHVAPERRVAFARHFAKQLGEAGGNPISTISEILVRTGKFTTPGWLGRNAACGVFCGKYDENKGVFWLPPWTHFELLRSIPPKGCSRVFFQPWWARRSVEALNLYERSLFDR